MGSSCLRRRASARSLWGDTAARAAVAEAGSGGSAGGGGGRQTQTTGCGAAPAVGSSCSSAPEGAMLPFAPQDQLWNQEMEMFGGGPSSGEVSIAAKGWSHPPPFHRTLAGGLREKGRGARELGVQAISLEAARWRSTETCFRWRRWARALGIESSPGLG